MPRFTLARSVRSIWSLQIFQNRRTLGRMIKDVFSGHYKMSFWTNVLFILGLLYIFFPFDFVPDFIPVVGWLDDGAILYLVLKRLQKETQRYNRFKVMERRGF